MGSICAGFHKFQIIGIRSRWHYALAICFWTLATKEELLAAVPELQKAAPFCCGLFG
jgi:hypothetical protein